MKQGLIEVQANEIVERRRARLELVWFAAVMVVVTGGVMLALRWIALTIQ